MENGIDKTSGQSEKTNRKISILIVDDHQMVRKGFRKIIEEEDDLYVVAEASNGDEAAKLTREHSPDIILMDVNMPIMDGIEATRLIKSQSFDSRIIGMSMHNQDQVMNEMNRAGASAYITKTEAFETLCDTIRVLMNDKVYM